MVTDVHLKCRRLSIYIFLRAGQFGPNHPKSAGSQAKKDQRAGRTRFSGSAGWLLRLRVG